MTELEKRAMGRTPFTRNQLEDRYAVYQSDAPIRALCESHMRLLIHADSARELIVRDGQRIAELEKEIDQLLAACETALAGYLEYVGEDVESVELKTDEEIVNILRKAIANAKGVQP